MLQMRARGLCKVAQAVKHTAKEFADMQDISAAWISTQKSPKHNKQAARGCVQTLDAHLRRITMRGRCLLAAVL